MSVWKNKHVVIAMLVAPVLAILAYYAFDFVVGEKPEPAREGQSYPLAEKPNCRYGSGICGLKNAQFELELTALALSENRVALTLTSRFPLDGVLVSLVEDDRDDMSPVSMQPRSGDGTAWSLHMAQPDPERQRLRLVASAQGSLYYGDVATKFTSEKSTADADH
jgi:hypothetical protein